MNNKSYSDLPLASHVGVLRIDQTEINCFIVPTGEDTPPLRLLSGRAVTNALGVVGRGQGMLRFIESKSLKSHIPAEIAQAIANPVQFRSASGGLRPAHGYTADILPKLCYAIMDARDESSDGKGFAQNERAYQQAKLLARGFSVVGINALVDEATGYQDVRDRLALQKMLDKYLAEEWRKQWAQTFPIEFYKEIYKLRGWNWNELTTKRTPYIGHVTNDIVYSRIHPELLAELKKKVPRNEQGKPKSKLFQGLSEEYGMPALKDHLEKVVLLMEVSVSWSGFYTLLNRKYPQLRKPAKVQVQDTAKPSSISYQEVIEWPEDEE